MADTCRFEGCGRPVARNGLCEGHRKQLQRKKTLTPLQPRSTTERLRLERERLEEALHRLEDARAEIRAEVERRGTEVSNVDTDGDDDRRFDEARRKFWEAADEYARMRVALDPFVPREMRLVPAMSPPSRRLPSK